MGTWSLSFINDDYSVEGCPVCACDNDVSNNGTSTCDHCGYKNILPCSECSYTNLELCNWTKKYRCTPFPNEVLRKKAEEQYNAYTEYNNDPVGTYPAWSLLPKHAKAKWYDKVIGMYNY